MQVVRLRRKKTGEVVQDADVYICRNLTMGGWAIQNSKWGNPFRVGKEAKDAPEAVLKYYLWLHGREPTPAWTPAYIGRPADLLAGIHELLGKSLGCFCKNSPDLPCHGDVLVFEATGVMPAAIAEILAPVLPGAPQPAPVQPQQVYAAAAVHQGGLPDLAALTLRETPQDGRPTPRVVDPNFILKIFAVRPELGRVRAMMVALALGDALGVPHERLGTSVSIPDYTGKLEHVVERRNRYTQEVKRMAAGSVSDDTQMTMALARSLIRNGGYDRNDCILSYERWANGGNTGMGTNTKKLFGGVKTLKGYQTHFDKVFPDQEARMRAQSNGSLMRCAPLACLKDLNAVVTDCSLTNPNPINIEADLIQVIALRAGLVGVDAETIWMNLFQAARTPQIQGLLRDVEICYSGSNEEAAAAQARWPFHDTPEGKRKGWVLTALFSSMMGLRRTLRDEDPDIEPLFKWIIEHPRSDTDTNASICGQLCGAVIGWENLIKRPQTLENIRILIKAHREPLDYPLPEEFTLEGLEQVCRDLTYLG